MGFVCDYVKKIAEVMLFNAFVSVILPEGSYKKYINAILGIMLVLIILSPVSDFFGQ